MQPQQAALNPTLEAYGPAATARTLRAGLRAAVIPDPKAVLAIGILILLMRIQRVQQQRKRQAQVIAIDALTEKERLAA